MDLTILVSLCGGVLILTMICLLIRLLTGTVYKTIIVLIKLLGWFVFYNFLIFVLNVSYENAKFITLGICFLVEIIMS